MFRQFHGLTFKIKGGGGSITNCEHQKTLDLIKFHNFNHKNSFPVVNKDTDLQRKIISIYSRAIGLQKDFFMEI